MARLLLILFMFAVLVSACEKNAVMEESALYGTWIKEGGGLPADTIRFLSKNDKNVVAFKFVQTGGINWPSNVEAEYLFSNGRLAIKNASGSTNDFFTADSFEWIVIKKEFSIKLYQLVQYISADYEVTYRKLE